MSNVVLSQCFCFSFNININSNCECWISLSVLVNSPKWMNHVHMHRSLLCDPWVFSLFGMEWKRFQTVKRLPANWCLTAPFFLIVVEKIGKIHRKAEIWKKNSITVVNFTITAIKFKQLFILCGKITICIMKSKIFSWKLKTGWQSTQKNGLFQIYRRSASTISTSKWISVINHHSRQSVGQFSQGTNQKEEQKIRVDSKDHQYMSRIYECFWEE